MHFSSKLWEQRGDGKRKLKVGSIPDTFGFYLKKHSAQILLKEMHAEREQVSKIHDI